MLRPIAGVLLIFTSITTSHAGEFTAFVVPPPLLAATQGGLLPDSVREQVEYLLISVRYLATVPGQIFDEAQLAKGLPGFNGSYAHRYLQTSGHRSSDLAKESFFRIHPTLEVQYVRMQYGLSFIISTPNTIFATRNILDTVKNLYQMKITIQDMAVKLEEIGKSLDQHRGQVEPASWLKRLFLSPVEKDLFSTATVQWLRTVVTQAQDLEGSVERTALSLLRSRRLKEGMDQFTVFLEQVKRAERIAEAKNAIAEESPAFTVKTREIDSAQSQLHIAEAEYSRAWVRFYNKYAFNRLGRLREAKEQRNAIFDTIQQLLSEANKLKAELYVLELANFDGDEDRLIEHWSPSCEELL